MSRRTPVRPALALATTALLLAAPSLAGCSGSASSDAGTTSRVHSSTSAQPEQGTASPVAEATYQSPTTAPTPLPVAAIDKTQAGIFVLVWVETLNYGYAQNDADPLRKSITLGCFTCANWVIDVQTHENEGTTQIGGAVHVRQLVYLGPTGTNFTFRALLDRDPGVTRTKDGVASPVVGSTGQVVDLQIGVTTSSLTNKESWTMQSITTPPSAPAPSPSN